MRACATGEHIKDATITVRKAGKGQQDYLVVTSVSTSVSAEGVATAGAAVCHSGDSLFGTFKDRLVREGQTARRWGSRPSWKR